MTLAIKITNDDPKNRDGKSIIYMGADYKNTLTLSISGASGAVKKVELMFPSSILTNTDVDAIQSASSDWTASAFGTTLTLGYTGSGGETDSSFSIKINNITSSNTSSTNSSMTVKVDNTAIYPRPQIFLMSYPSEAKNLKDYIAVNLGGVVYTTPDGASVINNHLQLFITNLNPNDVLVPSWTQTPTVLVSFVYGDGIGALTPLNPSNQAYSPWNIDFEVAQIYTDGKINTEWNAKNPDKGSGASEPMWTLTPTTQNANILGTGSAATASFMISQVAVAADPAQTGIEQTLIYVQFSNFPGFNEDYFTVPLMKEVAQPAIIYFDATPALVANLGDTVTLSWRTFDIARVKVSSDTGIDWDSADPQKGNIQIGTIEPFSKEIQITQKTTFSLQACENNDDPCNPFKAHSQSLTVLVPSVSIAYFKSDKMSGIVGAPATLSWQMSYAYSAAIDGTDGTTYQIPANDLSSGSYVVHPQEPTNYTLNVKGSPNPISQTLNLFFLQQGWSTKQANIQINAPFKPQLYSVGDNLFLVGGSSDNSLYQSIDGKHWTQESTPAFPARQFAAGASDGSTLWLMGGATFQTNRRVVLNDMWSSKDALNWTQITPQGAVWQGRSNFACVYFQNKLWIMGGLDINYTSLNDIWSYDLTDQTWTEVKPNDPCWSARSDFGLTAMGGTLYLFGGKTQDESLSGEFWYSTDGQNWTQGYTGSRWSRIPTRSNPVMIAAGNFFWMIGGEGEGGPMSDIYTYTSKGWVNRLVGGQTWNFKDMGYTINRNALWVAGGAGSGGNNQSTQIYYPANGQP